MNKFILKVIVGTLVVIVTLGVSFVTFKYVKKNIGPLYDCRKAYTAIAERHSDDWEKGRSLVLKRDAEERYEGCLSVYGW